MADKMKVIKGGTAPVDLRGKRAYDGGGNWPVGLYRFQLLGHGSAVNDGNPSAVAMCKALKGPNETNGKAGQVFQEYFSLRDTGENPAVGFWIGFLEALLPGNVTYIGADGQPNPATTMQGPTGRVEPRLDFVDGGPNGQGAIFDVQLEENSYTSKKKGKEGKEVTRVRFDRSSVKLVEASSFAKEQLGIAAGVAPSSAAVGATAAAPGWGPVG